MTNYKQLCADLVAWAEKASAHYYSEPGVLIQARTALAEPEPPSLKELVERARAALAEPEPEGPTDEEILELSQWHEVSYTLINGDVVYPMQEGTDMRDAVLSFTKAVLARWGQ